MFKSKLEHDMTIGCKRFVGLIGTGYNRRLWTSENKLMDKTVRLLTIFKPDEACLIPTIVRIRFLSSIRFEMIDTSNTYGEPETD